jgi:hypothetical protein
MRSLLQGLAMLLLAAKRAWHYMWQPLHFQLCRAACKSCSQSSAACQAHLCLSIAERSSHLLLPRTSHPSSHSAANFPPGTSHTDCRTPTACAITVTAAGTSTGSSLTNSSSNACATAGTKPPDKTPSSMMSAIRQLQTVGRSLPSFRAVGWLLVTLKEHAGKPLESRTWRQAAAR